MKPPYITNNNRFCCRLSKEINQAFFTHCDDIINKDDIQILISSSYDR